MGHRILLSISSWVWPTGMLLLILLGKSHFILYIGDLLYGDLLYGDLLYGDLLGGSSITCLQAYSHAQSYFNFILQVKKKLK